jgi:hypothetical protein
MARNRPRQQLALQLEPGLVARIKAEAAARGCTISALAARAFEAELSGPAALPCPAPESQEMEALAERVTLLEAQLKELRNG